MTRGELALAFLSGGVGFAIADFIDRYMATYNPSAAPVAGAAAPTYFTGGTNGTLANTLNIATSPGLLRIGVGIGVTAIPAIASYLVKNPMGRAALQGMMLGAGIKLFSTLWNAYVMGNLLKPAATDQKTMQASLGARLYPAEVVAAQNIAGTATGPGGTPAGTLTAPQGLNAPPRRAPQQQQRRFQPQQQYRQGVGDPGPFAMGQSPSNPCGAGMVQDSLNNQCSAPCWDGSTPANGQCPPQPTAGCPSGQVVDNGTGGCVNPCSDGTAPTNGLCGGTAIPMPLPIPQQPGGNPPYQPPGGWGGGGGCGLADQQGEIPIQYMGMIND